MAAVHSYAGRRYRLVADRDDASAAVLALAGSKLLVLDCEGVNLSRHGELCTLQLGSFNPLDQQPFVYIFDVSTLGRWLFDAGGLRKLLESDEVVKLTYDCRNDSDALQHQFDVRLAGVRDLQLLCYMLFPSSKRLLMGLGTALTKYVTGYTGGQTKTAVKKIFEEDNRVWKRRPLPEVLLEYCANDVFYFLDLYKYFLGRLPAFNRDAFLRRWIIASGNYADFKRSLPVLENSIYVKNPLLPLRIIPDSGRQLGDFPPIEVDCIGCRRGFHRSEMRGSKCLVCYMIDLRELE